MDGGGTGNRDSGNDGLVGGNEGSWTERFFFRFFFSWWWPHFR